MISIFTPTYNRAYILDKCYESLVNQTNKDFVWLLVDDGSTDNTESLVQNWKKEKKIDIQYIKQKNGGKHSAHNTAVKNCNTEYLLILDSDDILDSQCTSTLENYIAKIENDNNLCGIIGYKFKKDTHDKLGATMPLGVERASGNELYQKYNFTGDTLRLYKTKVLKKYLFPVVAGEKFIYENVVFDQIDTKYRMLIIHEKLYFCDYLEDGYTTNANKLKRDNPIGYALSINSSVEHSVKISKKINWTILYIIWCKKLSIPKRYKSFSEKKLYIVLYPLALLFNIMKFPKFFFKIFEKRDNS